MKKLLGSEATVVHRISDTARWAAVFRARETERPDALFRDPYAERLAGPEGFAIADALSEKGHAMPWVMRTYLFDRFITREIQQGADMVVNLAAGLDTRPYRMDLPPSLNWIEVDLPEILSYKENILANEEPVCGLERIRLDLLDGSARRTLLANLNRRARKILVLTEGLLMYLSPDDVATLATDLSAGSHFQHWILELMSPGLLDRMQRTRRHCQLSQADISYKFGPPEGPPFFTRYGWELIDAQGFLKTAVGLGRTSIDPRFVEFIPESPRDAQDSFPWVGACLFQRRDEPGAASFAVPNNGCGS